MEEKKEPKVLYCRLEDIESLYYSNNQLNNERKYNIEHHSTLSGYDNEGLRKSNLNCHYVLLVEDHDNIYKEYYSGEKVMIYDEAIEEYDDDHIYFSESYPIFEFYSKGLTKKENIPVSLFIRKRLVDEYNLGDEGINFILSHDISEVDEIKDLVIEISNDSKEEMEKYFEGEKEPSTTEYYDAYLENIRYNIKNYGKHKPITYILKNDEEK